MKNLIGHKVSTWNLKIFLSISMGIHLLVSIVLMQTPDLKIEKLPNIHVEVSLLPMIAEEKRPPKIVPLKLKPEFKEQESRPSRPEKEEPLPPKSLEPESSPPTQIAEEPKPIYKHKEAEKSETEPVPPSTAISLPTQSNPSSEKVENPFSLKAASIATPFYPTFVSKDLDETPFPNIGAREGSGNVSKLPPPSDNHITFIQPEYGENLKPLHPQQESVSVSKLPPPSNNHITFTQPKYGEIPKPLYPREARKKGFQGEVVLRVEVLANGRVGQVEIKNSSGYEVLDRSALTAVKEWKFIPAKKGEEAIPFWVYIPIKFQLQ